MALISRHPKMTVLCFVLMLIAGAVSMGMLLSQATDPILQIHAGSLTTYLPSSATNVQDIRPLVGHRGVNIEGTLRAAPGFALAIQGNPFENEWRGGPGMNGPVNLAMGTFREFDVDLSLPAPGFCWNVGRSYNHRQRTSADAHRDSDGYQGVNWFQTSQPEIVLHEDGQDPDDDVLYLVYGADRFIEFSRVDLAEGTSDTFLAVNGAAGVVLYEEGDEGEPDTYTYFDQHGNEVVFFGFDGDATPAEGQIWKMTDPDGNVAYVGDETTGSDAISSGFNANGGIAIAYDTAGRRYTYTYTTLDSVERLTRVKAEEDDGGWVERARVDYEYYSDESYGDAGDLKLVEVTTPLSDSGVNLTQKKYYRYFEGSYDAGTNPGYPHAIKLVVDFEGTRNFDWQDESFDEDFLAATNAALQAYASVELEYDASHRVDKATFNGSGCCGSGQGTQEYEYESNGSYSNDTGGYDTEWCTRTIVKRPDASYHTQYFDEAQQPLASVITDADPDNTDPVPARWASDVVRGNVGEVRAVYTPACVTAYSHSTGAITKSSSVGLQWIPNRSTSGDTKYFVLNRKFRKGSSGTQYYEGAWTYGTATFTPSGADADVVRPFVATRRVYPDLETTDADYNEWSYTTSVYSGTLAVETVTETQPTVSTGKNGSNSSVETKVNYNEDGTLAFQKSGTGAITYREYVNGQLTKLIQDADTTKTGSGQDFENVSIPSGFSSSGSPFHMKTIWTHDEQGREVTMAPPDGVTERWYYSQLGDERSVTLHYPRYLTTPSFYGPVDYVVSNHAGKAEATATVAISGGSTGSAQTNHVDESDDDPITAMDLGSVTGLKTTVYLDHGTQAQKTRLYFDVPASGAGTDGTNYDETLYGYDDSGSRTRVKEPTGTIHRAEYDLHGHVTERYIGTNDYSFDGGEPSGTDNMVKTEELVYDGDADDGNGLVTERTSFVEDGATGERVTEYTYDVKGNLLLQTNSVSPHAFMKVDNLGRTIATGLFSATTNIDVSADDPTTETSNRVGLSQSFFDERGDLWKGQVHKIDPDDGSNDDNVDEQYWRDADGRVIKTDGSQLAKTRFDTLGRVTHEFVLGTCNDSGYADADDVSGDVVLQENQSCYKASSGRLLMTARIDRKHDDTSTTGALDSNADGENLKFTANDLAGRIQMVPVWYDALGRVEDRVDIGDNGGDTYDRDAFMLEPMDFSAEVLRLTYTYHDTGRQEKIQEASGKYEYFEYDDAGRVTRQVQNYDADVNGGAPSGTDDNVTVKYEYTDGLLTKLTADLPSGQTDEDTLYTYGTTKGTSAGDSKIATGHLLQKIQYPDSAGGTDVVTFAYNALAEQIWKRDQAGNVFESVLDDGGRPTHFRWTTAVSGFDTAVRRISRTFDALGRPQLVTQYDNPTVGSGTVVDEARLGFDDWGPVSQFDYDRDSAVDAQGSDDEYTVSYTYEKNTDGRNAIRKTGMTLPSGNVISYDYEDTSSYDDAVSRVTEVKDGETVLCRYHYLGTGTVVKTTYDEPDVYSTVCGTTAGTYPGLDELNRVIASTWTKDLATDRDFYSTGITYDQGGNVTLIEDNVHSGFDVSYTNDDVSRLTRAEEGTWSGSAITSRTRDQQWTLDHVGNWDLAKLDLNGDGDFVDADESKDDRTHNAVNELTARDVNDDETNDYTLTYDAVGNLTDDGEEYEYEYDGFGRLRKIKDTSDQSLIVEMKYNGLGHMTAIHEDTDGDDDVDGSDLWYYRMYDERWRWVATFRASDQDPKEEFVPHQAGLDGQGGSSYIDLLILRDRDGGNDDWITQADGTLEERIYYCQNWRADVSALVQDTGEMVEWVKYSAYGVPFGLPRGDTDSDGDCDATDRSNINGWSSGYDVRCDVDLDGDIDGTDETAATNVIVGHGVSSSVGAGSGLAGYRVIASAPSTYRARHRVFSADLGRWLSRDPNPLETGGHHTHQAALIAKSNLTPYLYASSRPLSLFDPLGLTPCEPPTCSYYLGPVSATSVTVSMPSFGGCTIDCTYPDCPRDRVCKDTMGFIGLIPVATFKCVGCEADSVANTSNVQVPVTALEAMRVNGHLNDLKEIFGEIPQRVIDMFCPQSSTCVVFEECVPKGAAWVWGGSAGAHEAPPNK